MEFSATTIRKTSIFVNTQGGVERGSFVRRPGCKFSFRVVTRISKRLTQAPSLVTIFQYIEDSRKRFIFAEVSQNTAYCLIK
jgi:hypothetical protein